MFLIVGLGNPGKRYENTRHNVGFMTVDYLAEKLGITVNKLKFKGLYGQTIYKGQKIILLKPQTYMNLSGQSVKPMMEYFGIKEENLIVLTDDIDIEFGRVRIRKKGSAGTHNGLKSIIKDLGSMDFSRIKIAVGKKPAYMDLADFVLSRFDKAELKILKEEIELAGQACLEIIENGIDAAMNKTNAVKID